jgi:hypothetical protein
MAIGLFEEVGDFHAQPSRDTVEALDGGIPQPALNSAYICAMKFRYLGQRFLRNPSPFAERPNPLTK